MKQPTKSNILVVVIEGDSSQWPGFEIDHMIWNGESAEYEHEASMLEDAVMTLFNPPKAGKYLLTGFRVYYTKDYWGEVDADYELEGWKEFDPGKDVI